MSPGSKPFNTGKEKPAGNPLSDQLPNTALEPIPAVLTAALSKHHRIRDQP